MMKLFVSIGLLIFSANSLVAQVNFSRYFDESSLPLFTLDEHLSVTFKWDMKGNVQVFMNEGLNFLEEGNYELATTNFSEVIKLDSLFWASHYYRGICYKKLRKYKEAEKDFLTAMKLNATQAETCVELGEVYQAQRKLSKAADLYEQAIEINPTLVHGYFNLGITELVKGEVRKALKLFQKCNEVDPKFPEAYVLQGVLKFKEGKKNQESIAFFDKALKADSSYSQAYFWRGLTYVTMEQYEKSIGDWSRYIAFNPGNPFMLMMRGFLYIELNRFDEAFTDLRKALLSKTLNEEAFKGAQTLLDKQIDLQAAANYLIRNGYGLNEESFGFLKKGFCLLLASRKKEAMESLKKAEQAEPSATVFLIEAIAYEHLNDHSSAFDYYNKALELDNDIFDAHKKRSVYRGELKDWKGAYADFNDMLRLQPESLMTYRLRGLTKSVQGDYYGAIIDLTKYINSDSLDYESLRTRAVCLSLVKDLKGANEDLRRMLIIKPNDPSLYEDVSKNYLTLHDTANAIIILRQYAKAINYSVMPHLELAKIYVAIKKWDEARKEIDVLMPVVANSIFLPNEYSVALYLEGVIEFHHDSYEVAIDKFSKALKKNEGNLDAKYFRAKAYEKAGQKKKAISDLKDLKDKKFKDAESLYIALTNKP